LNLAIFQGAGGIIGMSAGPPDAGRSAWIRRYELMSDLMLGYLDPASGSILLQMLVGSILGLGLFFRHNVIRVFRLFRRSR
jgi:hypothetical protein